MPTVDAYVRHAREYGGLRDCWETAWDELDPIALGELAMTLRELGSRRRRVGRKGRTGETFTLTREETATLIERLAEAGVGDAEIRRYTGALPTSRNKSRTPANPSPGASVAARARATARRSHVTRACAWCSAPLPATLRGDARYCIGGKCKMAAHRARQAEAA